MEILPLLVKPCHWLSDISSYKQVIRFSLSTLTRLQEIQTEPEIVIPASLAALASWLAKHAGCLTSVETADSASVPIKEASGQPSEK